MTGGSGPLSGIAIVEFAAQGPGPFCGMLLADLGAEVILVERPDDGDEASKFGASAIFHRGKRSIVLDLKRQADVETALRLVERADGLIEGMRPGTMERLGLGPDVCLERNPHLVYGRMTGWGQSGPLAMSAGHDINYIALSGALWYAGSPSQPPVAPPTLVGDVGGGALYLAVGLLAGLLHVRAGGAGQIVDAAVVDGSAHMLNLLLSAKALGELNSDRGTSPLDGAHWWGTYACADGLLISLGPLEPKFYGRLLDVLGLADVLPVADQFDPRGWARGRAILADVFSRRPRADWCLLLEGSDCCFAPVLAFDEAAGHPHNRARGTFRVLDGVLQAAPAPRFSSFPDPSPGPIPRRGQHQDEVSSGLAARRSDGA
ncbi:MAG: L-carnitine dehydratase/bile acid-inducible protein [Enterovirga sp.]|nr:L-carnitine dehydratase/bile acid-inducible protein [Enterovirga sp.]